jgi:hypothetical protein
MESRKVKVTATVIDCEKCNRVINVPKSSTDEEAIALGHDYLRKQYPKHYAKDTILDQKVVLVAEPKPVDTLVEIKAKEAGQDAKVVDTPDTKHYGKKGGIPLETASRKQVKEQLKQVVA